MAMHVRYNRPFPNSLVPLFQSESKCETILKKMTFICMKKKLRAELIFIWKVSHFNSVWKRGTRELGKGLFLVHFFAVLCKTTTWNNQSLCPVNHDGYFSNFHRELNDLKVSRDSWKKFKVPIKWKIEALKNRCIWKAFKIEEECCFHFCHISYRSRDIHNFCIMQIRYWWCHKVWQYGSQNTK